MATYAYTKLADYILDQLWGFASVNSLKNSLRYIGEDILGDPSANAEKVTFANSVSFTTSSVAFLTNIGLSTPILNGMYGDLVPKAWAYTSAAGTLQAGVNLTVSKTATGTYQYTFRRNLANVNYCVVPGVVSTANGREVYDNGTKLVSGFTILTKNTVNTDLDHQLVVFGTQ